MKEDIIFIEHVLESIQAIKTFSQGMKKKDFTADRLRQSAIMREIEIIGEAMKNTSDMLRMKYKNVEWKKIIGTRDKMIHHYFGVDLDVVWNIVKKDLPILKKQIEYIKKEFIQKPVE